MKDMSSGAVHICFRNAFCHHSSSFLFLLRIHPPLTESTYALKERTPFFSFKSFVFERPVKEVNEKEKQLKTSWVV